MAVQVEGNGRLALGAFSGHGRVRLWACQRVERCLASVWRTRRQGLVVKGGAMSEEGLNA